MSKWLSPPSRHLLGNPWLSLMSLLQAFLIGEVGVPPRLSSPHFYLVKVRVPPSPTGLPLLANQLSAPQLQPLDRHLVARVWLWTTIVSLSPSFCIFDSFVNFLYSPSRIHIVCHVAISFLSSSRALSYSSIGVASIFHHFLHSRFLTTRRRFHPRDCILNVLLLSCCWCLPACRPFMTCVPRRRSNVVYC